MSKVKLPYLNDLLLKGFLTIIKGVKISSSDIRIEKDFEGLDIDKQHLLTYVDYFKFTTQSPLSYLYLLAQRAQVALMLEKKFTISIPGLIHISNQLISYSTLDVNATIDIKSSVFVESKLEGSLYPIFKIDFFQNNKKVAYCESKYIAIRKSKLVKNKREEIKLFNNPLQLQKLSITKKEALKYAQISGDKNPIHTSSIIAKVFGFKQTIIHGWYLVSKVISELELNQKKEVSSINCNFYKAIELPSSPLILVKGDLIQLVNNSKVSATIKLKF